MLKRENTVIIIMKRENLNLQNILAIIARENRKYLDIDKSKLIQ